MMIGPYIRINRGSTEENAYKYKELLRETEKIGIEKARLRVLMLALNKQSIKILLLE